MSIPIWCEIVCAQCARTATGAFYSGAIAKRALVQNAKREGFSFSKTDAFCSPKCEREFRPDEAARNPEGNSHE
mgnify:CR=1 FL=1